VKKKILVVEDDLPTRQLLKLWLSGEGYEVEFATDRNTAIDTIKKWHPDAVLLDILLPGSFLGFDICREAKQMSDTPVLIMTARTVDTDRQTAIEAGADEFVQKPFEWSELLAKVRSLLQPSASTSLTMAIGSCQSL